MMEGAHQLEQALFANPAVKHPLADLNPFSRTCNPDPDDDPDGDEDDDDSWEECESITFARQLCGYQCAPGEDCSGTRSGDERTLQSAHSDMGRGGSICEILKMLYRRGS